LHKQGFLINTLFFDSFTN